MFVPQNTGLRQFVKLLLRPRAEPWASAMGRAHLAFRTQLLTASLQDLSCGATGEGPEAPGQPPGKAVLAEGHCPQAEGALAQPSLGGKRLFNAGPVTEGQILS